MRSRFAATRTLGLGLLVVASVLLAGACGNGKAEVRVDKSDNGRTVELRSGGTLVISLPSNPTTGYGWSISDPTGGLKQQGEAEYTPSSTSTMVVGGGGTQTLTFKAGSAGTYHLGLAYVRSFEPSAAPADTFHLVVNVK